MDTSGKSDTGSLIAAAKVAETAAKERYRTAITQIPNESARRLFLSIIDQKQKHLDRLTELAVAHQHGTAEAAATADSPFYTFGLSAATLQNFLGLCAENELSMKALYEKLGSGLAADEERFMVDGFIADERKMVTWLTDYRDLLGMTSDLKQA